MGSKTPFTLKWGIMATGHIAKNFVKDLLTDPAIRDVHDVCHEVVAVASSSSVQKAVDFCAKVNASTKTKVYGSYAELVADGEIDIVYIATPHSHHFQNAMLALEAGKPILCEKAFTVTSSQARKLVETARTKQLFLMEAVWTRFFPLSIKVRELVASGVIGAVYRVIADNSLNRVLPEGDLDFQDSHRMVNLDLAGGAMLDLGIYSLTWLMQILYHLQSDEKKEPPNVVAAINKYHTGADEMTSFILQFAKHKSMGIGMTALRIGSGVDYDFTGGPPIKIQGSAGEIQVMGPAFKPSAYRVIMKDGGGHIETVHCPIPKDQNRDNWGHGMYWEADECARCLRDGKLESDTLPLEESIVVMEVMESTLRQGGVEYPQPITTDIYDRLSSLNTGRR
ncbi:NAD(P)-binding protein [Bimuria novae-zelandiae CBS 107.79]|uniref:D-xylose 1-dehydrogenase (NADP(+), D-xylono-1,5-lactone-forming) n=1 Tax=Bimuria novae-zelandiae CBS 107.79 TaxID=1447943 RepID=A0A6A5V6Q0_9PLEO|nr:NAD(P)-binding protein [Bimuria novae-zelandiae CBS 107.79]KAF1972795.1 NAD(P)-binding protein [Bimuria novae-zelandiae CBS 107.79]